MLVIVPTWGFDYEHEYHPCGAEHDCGHLNSYNAFYKLNARLALADRDENCEVALVGKNLTDETTISYATETLIGAGSFKAGTHYAFVQPPRTVAIQGMLRF